MADRFAPGDRVRTRAVDPAESFTVAAAIVRQLLTDPVLPDELLPAGWPAARLREAYGTYQSEVLRLMRSEPTGG